MRIDEMNAEGLNGPLLDRLKSWGIERIKDGTITQYVHDPNTARLVAT